MGKGINKVGIPWQEQAPANFCLLNFVSMRFGLRKSDRMKIKYAERLNIFRLNV